MRVPDVPPGFEGNHYATKQKLSCIPRIKWKRPTKFIISDSWLVKSGEQSTERQTENFRIAKVLEAIYPHRAAIPSRPSVSLDVEAERYDDSKTPHIRLTPIEGEWEFIDECSRTAPESIIQGKSEPKTPGSTGEPAPAMVSVPGADIRMAACSVLTALMKTKEPGSNIDPDLLFEFLTDPRMVQDLINNRIPKSSELDILPAVDTRAAFRSVSQHFTTSAPSPSPRHVSLMTLKPSFATYQPLTCPMSDAGQSSLAMELPQSKLAQLGQLMSSALPVNNKPIEVPAPPRITTFSSLAVGAGPKPLQKPQPADMVHQPALDLYPMNASRVEVFAGQNSSACLPSKSLDYFKNLIREHGVDRAETRGIDQHPLIRMEKNNAGKKEKAGEVKGKIQKPCMYFWSPKGCKLGEKCTFLHDKLCRLRPDAAVTSKRTKFAAE